MPITASNALRDVKIKTGVVSRLEKELASYEKELISQQGFIERTKADPEKDEWDVKKQKKLEVLKETQDMIPDVEKRLIAARQNLSSLVQELAAKDDLVLQTEEVKLAKEILNE